MRQPSEPIFNVPAVVTATIAVLCIVHIAFEYLLPADLARRLFYTLAFVPARYDSTPLPYGGYYGGFFSTPIPAAETGDLFSEVPARYLEWHGRRRTTAAEIPQAANRLVAGVGCCGSVVVCVVGAELLVDGLY